MGVAKRRTCREVGTDIGPERRGYDASASESTCMAEMDRIGIAMRGRAEDTSGRSGVRNGVGKKERTLLQSAKRREPLPNPVHRSWPGSKLRHTCTERSAVANSATASRCPVGRGINGPGANQDRRGSENLSFSQYHCGKFQLLLSLSLPIPSRACSSRHLSHPPVGSDFRSSRSPAGHTRCSPST